MLLRYLAQHPLPMTVEISGGKHRSLKQNKLQRLWMNEIAEQKQEESAEYWRGYCKLHFGVAIRRENEKFAEAYDRDIRPLPYELKLKLMMVPHDMPITRDMNSKQMKRYLDEIQRWCGEQGIHLTDPRDMGWKDYYDER